MNKYEPMKIDFKYLYKRQEEEYNELKYIKKELAKGLVFVVVLIMILSLLIIL